VNGAQKLARVLNEMRPYPGDALRLAYGEVTDTAPFTVHINDGDVVDLDRDSGYTPVVGDVVYCLVQGTTVVVVGAVTG
jgi:hypothetical protein